MRLSVVTLGCKTNQFESAAMQEQLVQAGYQLVPFEQGADLVVINTCTVTAKTDAQSRKLIRKARRYNAGSEVVVTGCYAQINPEQLARLPGVRLVLGNQEKADLLTLLQNQGDTDTHVSDIRNVRKAQPLPLHKFAEKSRAFIQIQNGCDAYCSYCIIPYARGRSRSVPPEDIRNHVDALTDQGYQEVVFTGIHIGGYGRDLTPSLTLADLVEQTLDQTSLPRLRLGSVEPNEIDQALIDLLANDQRLCPHLHIPLQSGSDTVLQRMNRHYTTKAFQSLVQRLTEKVPDIALGLDVIVGFPGETEEEFQQTLALLQQLPVAFLHVFPYSPRPGTPAATMAPQVPVPVRKARAAQLRHLGDKKSASFRQRFVATSQDAVALGGGKGLTAHYLTVSLPPGDYRPGQIYPVLVT